MRSTIADTIKFSRTAKMARSTAYSAAGGSNKVLIDVPVIDPCGCCYGATGYNRIVCKESGIYQVTGCLGIPGSQQNCQPMIYKNGVYIAGGAAYYTAATGGGAVVTTIVPLAVSDYVEFWSWLAGAGQISGSGVDTTYLMMSLVESKLR